MPNPTDAATVCQAAAAAPLSMTAVLTGATAVSAAVVAWIEYRRKDRWRAAELAARLIDQIAADDELDLARHVLDWGFGPIIVPKKYRPYLAQTGPEPRDAEQRGEVASLLIADLLLAMSPQMAFHPDDNKPAYVMRECFDKLFGHLNAIWFLLERGQLYRDDLAPLKYWLTRIAKYEYSDPVAPDLVFQPFLMWTSFDYRGVVKLGMALGVGGWSEDAQTGRQADALASLPPPDSRQSPPRK